MPGNNELSEALPVYKSFDGGEVIDRASTFLLKATATMRMEQTIPPDVVCFSRR